MKLDQHFIGDDDIVKSMISLAEIDPDDVVLEVGAGSGKITEEIAKVAGRVLAVEKDPEVGAALSKKISCFKNVRVFVQNALEFLDNLNAKDPGFDRIVSNTPYSISEALIQRMMHLHFKKGIFIFPKSFAYRLVAKSGDVKYSKLSFLAQEFFDIEIGVDVPKMASYPVPKTSSAVVIIKPKEKRSLVAELVLMDKMKLKNALREIICNGFFGGKQTKREAKKAIDSLCLDRKLLDKRVKFLKEGELKHLDSILHNTSFRYG